LRDDENWVIFDRQLHYLPFKDVEMSITQVGHVLDNPSWYALNSHHAHFAIGTDLAKRYPPDVFIGVALVDHSDDALHDLRQIVAAGESIILFEADLPEHFAGWTIQHTFRVDQLVCEERIPQPENHLDIVELNVSDVPDIMALIDLAHPGPFFPRTIEMGRFIGIHQEGRLVAMAGERGHLTGYCEISTVCTHPDWQGRGYARLLTSHIANGIWERGETPLLAVIPDNAPAYHLYESMHFRKRRSMVGYVMSHA
jgi:predicted GNAT family acetyltransferase